MVQIPDSGEFFLAPCTKNENREETLFRGKRNSITILDGDGPAIPADDSHVVD